MGHPNRASLAFNIWFNLAFPLHGHLFKQFLVLTPVMELWTPPIIETLMLIPSIGWWTPGRQVLAYR